ncbi:DNA-directed RNA polymerase II subunit RPB1-like [Leptopilina heterotoma]|uniref:DNA-directed RNA polymerase II subunit RPB1-like n=1 Tax=Leptopilina heterotoma TaxID=63436 RepID=UPI001CA82F63|nr:DNA-directed RNA polymerase II subunit RPB1-like [Leptopilina heterotoma]
MSTAKSKMPFHSVKRVQFGILSPDEIRRMSVTEEGIRFTETFENGKPKGGGLMDPRQGAIDDKSRCQTCDGQLPECPGHFGHINLAKPVFHIGFLAKTIKILRCVCFFCSKLLISPNDPNIRKILTETEDQPGRRLTLIHDLCVTKRKCGDNSKELYGCGQCQPNFKRSGLDINVEFKQIGKEDEGPLAAERVHGIFKNITDEVSLILGMDPKSSRPEWMILTVLPVPPLTVRPNVKSKNSSITKRDDLTKILSKIVTTNNKLLSDEIATEADDVRELQFHISLLIDNNPLGVFSNLNLEESLKNALSLKSIKERFKGQNGRLRCNLLGKSVNFTARSIITPDPNLRIDQIGIPQSVAKNLTFPEIVTPHNIKKLQKLVKNGDEKYPGAKYIVTDKGKVIDLKSIGKDCEIKCGYRVERHICDNDLVVCSRQPSSHKLNMMGYRVKVLPGSTFRLNVSCASAYDDHFNSDEINLHVPQSYKTRAEVENLRMISGEVVTKQANKSVISIVEDALLGAFKITQKDVFIEKSDFMNLLMFVSNWDGIIPQPCILKPKPLWSGNQVVSLLIPKNLNYVQGTFSSDDEDSDFEDESTFPEEDTVTIKKGEIITGCLSEDTLGCVHNSLPYVCRMNFGHQVCMRFCQDLQNVMNNWLLIEGHSVGIGDTIANPSSYLRVQEIIEQTKENVIDIIIQAHCVEIDRNTFNLKSYETSISANEKIHTALRKYLPKPNNLIIMVKAGSAGKDEELRKIIGCKGQQTVEGERIPFGFCKRTLPHFIKDDYGPESRGFVDNSHLSGFTPSEFYFHAMEGRDFLIDSYKKSEDVGRMQRNLVKAMESIMVNYDGTVRNAQNQLLQIYYGNKGFHDEVLVNSEETAIEHNSEEFEKEFKFDLTNERVRDKFNENIYRDMMNSKELISELKKEFEQLCEDKAVFEDRRFNFQVPLPFNLEQMIYDAQNDFQTKNVPCDLNPLRVIQGVRDLLEKCVIVKGDDKISREINKNTHFPFRYIMRLKLCTKAVFEKYQLSSQAFEWLISEIENRFHQAIVPPGEMVGVLAAQTICNSLSHMPYNTFHHTGATKCFEVYQKYLQGVTRIKEIINCSKMPKYPSLTIYLKPEISGDVDVAKSVLSRIEHTTLKNLLLSSAIYYDPDINNTVIPEDQEFVNVYQEVLELDPSSLSPWLLRFELDRNKMLPKEIKMENIANKLYSIFGENLNVMFNDDSAEHLILRIRIVNGDDDEIECEDDVFLRRIESFILNDIAIHGHEMIKKVHLDMSEQSVTNYNKESQMIETRANHRLKTEGTNLMKVLVDKDVDSKKTISNDIHEIFNVLGIEAARKSIEKEMTKVFENYSYHRKQEHFILLSEVMTANGHLTSIDNHGFDKEDLGAFLRWSAKENEDVLFDAACHGEVDPLKDVTGKNILGQLPRIGTGCFDLLLDNKTLLRGKDAR